MLAALLLATCVPATLPAPTSAPPTSAIAAEPTRPPSCPSNYPDPKAYNESAYEGTGTVVAVVDGTQMRVTVDVPPDHPFAGQILLLHLHGSAKIPGGVRDLVVYGLRSGDRVQLDVWKFLPADCSYSVVKVEKLAT
jgi:hypothetical protein